MGRYLLELALVDARFIKYTPSKFFKYTPSNIAASALYLANKIF